MDWYGWALPVEQSAEFRVAVEKQRDRWPAGPLSEFVTKMGRLTLPAAQHFDIRVADKTVERIAAARGAPWMITCSFNDP
jgi:hypothetical protein